MRKRKGGGEREGEGEGERGGERKDRKRGRGKRGGQSVTLTYILFVKVRYKLFEDFIFSLI